MDGRSKVGKWIGFDEISNGHRVYWPEKRSVTVEHSIKFVNGDVVLPPIPAAQLIQGEKESMNLQHIPEITKSETPDHKLEDQEHTSNPTTHQPSLDNPIINPMTEENEVDPADPQDQWQCTPFNRVTDELVAARSGRIRIPTRYVRDIQNGVGTADNRPSRPNLPTGIQISEPTTQPEIEGETNHLGQIEHAMASAVSEIEAIDPQSLEEAM